MQLYMLNRIIEVRKKYVMEINMSKCESDENIGTRSVAEDIDDKRRAIGEDRALQILEQNHYQGRILHVGDKGRICQLEPEKTVAIDEKTRLGVEKDESGTCERQRRTVWRDAEVE